MKPGAGFRTCEASTSAIHAQELDAGPIQNLEIAAQRAFTSEVRVRGKGGAYVARRHLRIH
jgi:hypothetical protein